MYLHAIPPPQLGKFFADDLNHQLAHDFHVLLGRVRPRDVRVFKLQLNACLGLGDLTCILDTCTRMLEIGAALSYSAVTHGIRRFAARVSLVHDANRAAGPY